MNKAYIFVFGGTSTFLLSVFFFIALPRYQAAQISEREVSVQTNYTKEELAGRTVYIEYGCVYCHSQQVRPRNFGADQKYGWGEASDPAEYVHDKPHLLGTMRTGPDLSNIGRRQPSKDWHHLHLYDPQTLVEWSLMPKHPFLYTEIESEERPAENALSVPGKSNTWIVPSEKAEALVTYLLSLDRGKKK